MDKKNFRTSKKITKYIIVHPDKRTNIFFITERVLLEEAAG